MVTMMKKIGILGGTYNPIHIGHLLLAEAAMNDAGLEQVWFIPAGKSYMKQEAAVLPAMERYHMVQLAVQGNPRLRCLDAEVCREGNTYSYETMEQLRESYPDVEFSFLLGADCLFTIENWKCPERIFASCSILAAVREGADITAMEQKQAELVKRFGAQITLLPFRHMEISSTEIRQMIMAGKSIRYLVPELVNGYITDRGFYKDEGN